jgi:HK97 family phage portal protein
MSGTPGTETHLHAMTSSATLFTIVDSLASDTAGVTWRLWQKSPSGKKEDRKEVTRHPALVVWQKPNQFQTQQEFVETFSQHYELAGEAWWIVGRGGMDLPDNLWCVMPHRMNVVPNPERFIAGYTYTGPDGQKVPLEVEDVVQLKRPNPYDPFRGLSAVASILEDVQGSKAAAAFNRNFFVNGAVPGGIVESPNQVEDHEFETFTKRWRESHQGVRNAHRVAMLENGQKWVNVSYSMRDMMFDVLRQVSDEQVRRAYRYPKPMLGDVDDINRANAEAGELVYGRWLLRSRLERIKGALNNDFLPMFQRVQGAFGDQLEFDYDDPSPADKDGDADRKQKAVSDYVALLGAGVDPKEAAEVCGLPVMTVTKPEPKAVPAGMGGRDEN